MSHALILFLWWNFRIIETTNVFASDYINCSGGQTLSKIPSIPLSILP